MSNPFRLFLIEDDDDIALLVRKHLEKQEHHVVRCRTGADAVIVLRQTPFDLVILDHFLPDMTGLQLLQVLAGEGISVPVLIVTGKGDESIARDALQAGALDYIVKDSALTFLYELPKRVGESVTRHRLEQMNRLLIQALDSARDGIMITDLQGKILKVNPALEAMTGYSPDELLGATPRILRSSAHPPTLFADLWHTILERQSWQGELTNRRKDGTLYQTSITISPIVDAQGRLTHFVGIQRDVTEHKHLERQLLQAQKMQSVGTLAGGVAHEFNNLLAGITGYVSLGLRETALSSNLRDFLQRTLDLAERAASLTRQLLAFARKPALSRQPTVMHDLVKSTADLVGRTLHQEVHAEMEELTAEGDALLVEADANQLQQAMVNLALNARDAIRERQAKTTPSEGLAVAHAPPPIVFRLRSVVLTQERPAFPQQVPPGDYVLLEVEDQGMGMPSEVLNQALDPFFTTKEVGQGTGLGLPMVFGIVQGHQGYLTIDSSPSHGTRIGLYLPRLVRLEGMAAANVPVDASNEPEPGLARTILVVDDEEAVLDVVRRFLEIAGHHVLCATSGHEALSLLGPGRAIDLIILDLMMPREDPSLTFQRLRQRRPGVPILLCTGLPQASVEPELLRQSSTGLLRKPFRTNELWAAVKQALHLPEARAESDPMRR